MKSVKLFLAALFVVLSCGLINAQNIQVKGTVTDAADNAPLIGAGVQVKGSAEGVVTDLDGNFIISCPSNATLVFSYLNYVTQEIAVNGKSVINVSMQQDAVLLEETVVVGYGTAKKISSVVGAATTVKKKVFENRPVASAGDALQGQVAGLQVFTSSGEPTATVSMRLRGVNSINASNTPLFVLDGSPVSSSIFTTLNSNDIENITVLKDASATAIYGSRAANGVVYITTKKGTSERPVIKLSAQYGISEVAGNPIDMCNSEQYFRLREMIDPALKYNKDFQDLKEFRLANNIGINWRDWILNESAPTVSADLSISGRTAKTDYYVSLGFFDQTGIEPNSFMTRYSVRSNINTKLTDWLKFGINLGLTYQESRTQGYTTGNSWYNPMSIADWNLPYAVPYEILTYSNGKFKGYGEEQDYITDMGTYNYYYLNEWQPRATNYIRLNGNTYQEITPLKGLTIRAAQALEGYDYRNSGKILKDPLGAFASSTGAWETFSRSYGLTATNTIEYKFDIAEKNHFILLAGQEAIVNKYESFGAESSDLADNRTAGVHQGVTPVQPTYSFNESVFNSYFARLNYDYNDKYFFEASYRRDGSSLFGENKRYANFYSFGASWNAKKENFLKDADWVNKLQVRASYGITGNAGISEYLANGMVGTSSIYDGAASWGLSQVANPDLTWETVATLSVGINARLFNFMDVEVEYYNKETKDMLMEIPYSFSTGFSSGWGNVGNMKNQGVDLTLGFDVVNTKDISFNVRGTFGYNANKITKLFGGRDEFIVPNTGIKYNVGYPYGEFFYVRWAGVDPANGKQIWYTKDGKLTNTFSEDDAVFTGKQRYAPFSAGLQLDFAWKGLSVNANFSGVFGKWTLSNTRYFIENSNFAADSNQSVDMLQIWQKPGDITRIPAAGEELEFDTHLLENASFVRLKHLQISYSLPKAWMNKTGFLAGLRVYAIGRNLLTFTNYTGYDPEVDSNLQMGNYPNSRQYSFGIELTF